MKRQPRTNERGCNVALWRLASDEEVMENRWDDDGFTSPAGNVPQRKHIFYVGTPKRIQQITEEEQFLQKDEIQVTPLPAVVLKDIWQTDKNMPTRPFNPTILARNSFLTQPEHYSRHRGTGVYPSGTKNNKIILNKKDGAVSKRWPPKQPNNQSRASRDTEDKSHP